MHTQAGFQGGVSANQVTPAARVGEDTILAYQKRERSVDEYPTAPERQTLQRLAERVAEIAALPVQRARAQLWQAMNSLQPERPMVLADPQNGWRGLCQRRPWSARIHCCVAGS